MDAETSSCSGPTRRTRARDAAALAAADRPLCGSISPGRTQTERFFGGCAGQGGVAHQLQEPRIAAVGRRSGNPSPVETRVILARLLNQARFQFGQHIRSSVITGMPWTFQ